MLHDTRTDRRTSSSRNSVKKRERSLKSSSAERFTRFPSIALPLLNSCVFWTQPSCFRPREGASFDFPFGRASIRAREDMTGLGVRDARHMGNTLSNGTVRHRRDSRVQTSPQGIHELHRVVVQRVVVNSGRFVENGLDWHWCPVHQLTVHTQTAVFEDALDYGVPWDGCDIAATLFPDKQPRPNICLEETLPVAPSRPLVKDSAMQTETIATIPIDVFSRPHSNQPQMPKKAVSIHQRFVSDQQKKQTSHSHNQHHGVKRSVFLILSLLFVLENKRTQYVIQGLLHGP